MNIKSSPNIYAFAEKTTNIYKLLPQDYKKLLHENITKSYKKSPTCLEKFINLEAKEIAAGVKLDDRIEYMAKAPVYITLKDHKDNFRSVHPSLNKLTQKRNRKDQQINLRKYKQKSTKTSPSKPVEEFGKCH